MGAILEPELREFRIQRIPVEPVQAQRIVRAPFDSTVIVDLGHERYAVLREIKGIDKYYHPLRPDRWHWQSGYITAMHRLGALTGQEVEVLRARSNQLHHKREVNRAVLELERSLKTLGVELTKGQRNKLDKLQKEVNS